MKNKKTPSKVKSERHLRSTSTIVNDDPEPVLLAVTGMSPAILTETVWALAHEKSPVIPRRVIVVTTVRGRQEIVQRLLTPLPQFKGQTAWEALRSSLKREGHDLDGRLIFGKTHDDIRVMTTSNRSTGESSELQDIRTPVENEAAANFFLDQVRGIVENDDQQLIASLAGGRKTMGALLYACMNLAARETDRLTHVLVNEPFDTLPDFFFPGQPAEKLTDRAGKNVDARKAKVELADVPFVPLRNLFVRELNRKAGSFSRLVDTCREGIRKQATEKVKLTIETARPLMEVNGTQVTLAPREHLFMLFLARRAKESAVILSSYFEALTPLEEFRKTVVEGAPENNYSDWRHADGLKTVIRDNDDQDIRKLKNSIKAKLYKAGGDAVYLIQCLPEKGRCSLDVPPSMIYIK